MNLKNKNVESIVVSSMNSRGLQDKLKHSDVLDYFNNLDTNIICLQDTHWTEKDFKKIYKLWNNPIYLNGISTNSRGVCILFKSNFEFNVNTIIKDKDGNSITIDLTIASELKIRIINIYSPNNDSPEFYDYVESLIENNPSDYLIICGDFNMVLDPNKDSKNYKHINNPKARQKLKCILDNHNLIDIYRYRNPDSKKYTWRRKNPIKLARLDYFITSESLSDIVTNTDIIPGYKTDHSIITLEIKLNNFIRGRGTWKFNCCLLRDLNYLNLVNKTINETKSQYALPVYNHDNIDLIPDNLIQFTISDQLFLETLLLNIRGQTIKYSSYIKRKQNKEEEMLILEINEIENNNSINNSDLLEDKKIQLEEIRHKRLKGQMIRSRIISLDEGERPTKYFCSLENKNYLSKTIKKISIHNKYITDQKLILSEIKSYYKNLFSNNDDQLTNVRLEDLFQNVDINKLTKSESDSLEGELTILELSNALSKMKNNKTPGIDGYPADFFKVFWAKIKYFVLRSINQGFEIGMFSTSMRQCIISCLPKGNKPRHLLKNWRPISLLNVTYKLSSSVLAHRMKNVLPNIISTTQAGFLPGRFIGECTRLIYDLLNHCEQKKINGLIMLIDFEKAFDSISWNFLHKCLTFFNFGSDFRSKINTLNNNITASILQCGHLSEFFEINRGCRQGDPIATYEFIVVVQILYIMIENDKNIKGIIIDGLEYKLSQFADDTTIPLDGTQASLQAALNTLEVFGTYSGLKLNTDKTKIVWIGAKKHSKIKLNTNPVLQWGSTTFDLLGITFSVNLEDMIEINYEKYLKKMYSIINHWNKRYLTPIGKITVIKTFILSQFIHLFTALPNPTQTIKNTITKALFNFLWDNKPDKIKRTLLTQEYVTGGLKMINLDNFISSLKISWIRRIILSNSTPWLTLFENTVTTKNNIIYLGSNYLQLILKTTHNQFWKDVLNAWYTFTIINQPTTIHEKLCSPLWYNPNICQTNLYSKKWYSKGISTISDIIDTNLEVLSPINIKTIYDTKPLDFLTQHRISTLTKNYITSQTNPTIIQISKPNIPFQIAIIIKDKRGISRIYKKLNKHKQEEYSYTKWNNILNIHIDESTWRQIYKICHFTIRDNYLVWMQYRILNRIIGCKYLLFKMSISETDRCNLCDSMSQTIIHIFAECVVSQTLWNNISAWILNKTNYNIIFDTKTIILGYLINNNISTSINTIILVTKSYIFWCSRRDIKPCIYQLQIRIKDTYETQKAIACLNNKEELFDQKWKYTLNILDNI